MHQNPGAFCVLEGEVVGSTFARSGLLSRREGCGGSLRSSVLSRCEWCGSGNSASHLTTNDVIGTNIVIPTSVELACIDVELYGDLLAGLNVELFDAVFTEDVEHHLAGVLTWYLNDIFLCHPCVSCTVGNTTSCLHDGNDFSC